MAASCARGGPCKVGDRGPGGGIVVIVPGTAGNFTGKYFEAAPRGWYGTKADPALPLCTAPRAIRSYDPSAIGTGSANTARILASRGCATGTTAASAARGYAGGGKRDWFLPSPDEARPMDSVRAGLGLTSSVVSERLGMQIRQYWTSQRAPQQHIGYPNFVEAEALGFGPGNQSRNYTESEEQGVRLLVRPMRAFTAPVAARRSCVVGEGCEVGDVGPGGGTVFITPSTPGNTTGKYFEVAPQGWTGETELHGQLCAHGHFTQETNADCGVLAPGETSDRPKWLTLTGGPEPLLARCLTLTKSIPATQAQGIGAGSANTDALLGVPDCATGTAAGVARGYGGGGKSDWFLPSTDELRAVYDYGTGLGMVGTYWSSSQKAWTGAENVSAFGQDFSTGAVDSYNFGLGKFYSLGGLGVRPVRMF